MKERLTKEIVMKKLPVIIILLLALCLPTLVWSAEIRFLKESDGVGDAVLKESDGVGDAFLKERSVFGAIRILKESDGVGDAVLKESDGVGVAFLKETIAEGAGPLLLISGNNGTYTYLLVDATDPVYNPAVQVTGTGNTFENCTFYSATGVAFDADESCTVTNSIIQGASQDIDIAVDKTVTGTNNNLHHSANATTNIGAGTYTDTASVFASDPMFRDKATRNFGILAGSPCIGTGSNTGADTDLAGRVVPSGGTYDIGAYEYYGYTWRRSVQAGISGSILGGIN